MAKRLCRVWLFPADACWRTHRKHSCIGQQMIPWNNLQNLQSILCRLRKAEKHAIEKCVSIFSIQLLSLETVEIDDDHVRRMKFHKQQRTPVAVVETRGSLRFSWNVILERELKFLFEREVSDCMQIYSVEFHQRVSDWMSAGVICNGQLKISL